MTEEEIKSKVKARAALLGIDYEKSDVKFVRMLTDIERYAQEKIEETNLITKSISKGKINVNVLVHANVLKKTSFYDMAKAFPDVIDSYIKSCDDDLKKACGRFELEKLKDKVAELEKKNAGLERLLYENSELKNENLKLTTECNKLKERLKSFTDDTFIYI